MKKDYEIKGMSCAICKNTIEKNVAKMDGVISCQVNLLDNDMLVEYDESKLSEASIKKTVDDLGYEMLLEKKKEIDFTKIKLIVSVVLMVILMYLSMGHMLHLPNVPYSNFLQLVIATVIYILEFHYFKSGVRSILHLSPNMDALVTLSCSVSYLYSLYALYKLSIGDTSFHLYFETGAMILVIVSIGKYIEGLNKEKTTKAVRLLATLRPMEVTVIKEDGLSIIKIDDLQVGDVILTRAGESVGQDGVILEGEADIDMSMLTGESLPVHKKVGDEIIGGTIALNGSLKIKVTKTSADSTLSKIIELTKEATLKKIPIQRFADKISSFFVPGVILISIITFIVWYIFTSDFEKAMNFALSVLVISCPCALGLATPSAIMVATGVSAKNGILIKNPEVLEIAHSIKTIVLDKTGTITENKPQIVKEKILDADFKEILVALEKNSKHPIAKAVLEHYEDTARNFSNLNEISGEGIKAIDAGHTYLAGNKKLMEHFGVKYDEEIIKEAIKEHYSYIMVAMDDRLLGVIYIADIIKESSKKAIADLKAKDIKVIMCTGDNEIIADKIAKEVGVDEVIAEVKPEDKYATIDKEKANGLVAMVGDGINDAIALSAADVSFAISSGSDIAYESSDLILMKNDLSDIPFMIDLSHKTMKIIKENLFWALFYNSIFIPVAAGVFYPSFGFSLNPMIGAFSMSLSSIIVLSNALRIRNMHKNETIEIKEEKLMKTVVGVNGMMCEHCVKHVKDALEKRGVKADVSLAKKRAVIEGEISDEAIRESIGDAGYEVVSITHEG